MSSDTREHEEQYQEWLQRERNHFNRIARRPVADLKMPVENIQRYFRPPADTVYPLEYAFHLLGPLEGQTVLCLGCGEGLDAVILAALGANVIAVDISDQSIALASDRAKANGVADKIRFFNCDAAALNHIENNSVDKALCAAILHHIDIPAAVREIQRVLKPGGAAVFSEPVEGPALVQPFKNPVPKGRGVSEDERPLTKSDVTLVSKTVGAAGRRRRFWVAFRLFYKTGIRSSRMIHLVCKLDAWLIRRSSLLARISSPLVWEAVKR